MGSPVEIRSRERRHRKRKYFKEGDI